ncbi:MAG: DUF1573 domain-containing protein [Acidobacteriota bacterium]|nr:DUF1573 domain-containing protein [Acidobacteriota bacterium]
MKKYSILILIASALFSYASGPKLKMDKPLHDFGDIDKGKKVNAVFKFENAGDEALEILDVGTSCGCTTAKPAKTVYQPGEKGEIPVEFNSQRFNGPITKRITITTNDAETPKTVVTIKGFVTVDINHKPASIFFSNAKMGEKVSQEININTTKLSKLEISNIQTRIQPECLSAELVQVDDKTAKIVVTADGSKFPSGKSRFSGHLTFDTNSETQKTLRLPVTVHIRRPVKVSPNSVYFFASKQGKTRQVTIKVMSTEGKSFNVTEMKSDLDYITVKSDKDEGTSKFIIATLSDKAPVGKFNGKITLTTDVADQGEIVLPIRGSVIQ